MLPLSNRLISVTLTAVFFTTLVICLLLYSRSQNFSYENLDHALNPWTTTQSTSVSSGLADSLRPEIYTIFQQVYAKDEPPDLRLEQIEQTCSTSNYKPDLYLDCELYPGGLATLMAAVEACLALAFWLGTNIVIPTTRLRNDQDPAVFDEAHLPLGRWIDRDFLIQRTQKACPKMKIALLDEQRRPNLPFGKSIEMSPYGNNWWAVSEDSNWKGHVETQLVSALDARTPEESGDMVIKIPVSGLYFNRSSSAEYRQQFKEEIYLLRAVQPVRDIIHELVSALSDMSGSLNLFYGVHFRAEQDAMGEVKNGWVTIEQQLERIFKYAEAARVISRQEDEPRVIYLACGEEDKIAIFRTAAEAQNWTVVDKWSIANSHSTALVESINALDFDHMAMIDISMLLLSDYFFGPAESSFSYTIAHDRHPSGRYSGNYLDLDALQMLEKPDVVRARTHLFDITGNPSVYQCCF